MIEISQLAQLTDDEIRASLAGQICIVCDRPKGAGAVFCATDWGALALPTRWQLGQGFANADFAGMFRGWAQHLRKHSERKRIMPSRPGELTFRSTDEMEAAGYKWSGRAQCGSPRCFAPILWVRRPDGSRLALDEPQLQPHRFTCKDPEYFRRRREQREALKTSAGRRRRSR